MIAVITISEVLPTAKLMGFTLDSGTFEGGDSEQLAAGEVGGGVLGFSLSFRLNLHVRFSVRLSDCLSGFSEV